MARPKLNSLNGEFTKDYTLGKYLGGGADGKVYSVKSKRTGLVYAAKLIVPRTKKVHEAHIGMLLKYTSHENVVQFGRWYTSVGPGKPVVLLFEHCELGTLADLVVSKHGRCFQAANHMAEGFVRPIFIQLLCALMFLHEPASLTGRGPIVHRDIKPNNIVVTKNPYGYRWPFIKLCDFGGALEEASRNCDGRKPQRPGGVLAAFSRGFAPPELGWPPKKSAYDSAKPAYDIYSVGATIFWVIRRIVPPLDTKTVAPRGQASSYYYSKDFWDILRGALQRKAGSRWSRKKLHTKLLEGWRQIDFRRN